MIKMNNWLVVIPTDSRCLGYDGENKVHKFEIVIEDGDVDWGFKLDLESETGEKVSVPLLRTDNVISFELADNVRFTEGKYSVQVIGEKIDGSVRKSNIFNLHVLKSINSETIINPTPEVGIYEMIVEEVKKDVKDGFSPIATVEQTSSGATIRITDKNGTTVAELSNGKDGADGVNGKDGQNGVEGKTPLRGIDYWTEDDKEEIHADNVAIIEEEFEKRDQYANEFVSSVDEMTDTSKRYVLETTGTIWEYGETSVDDTDRNLFNIDEIALNQNPDGSTRNGSFTTGFIPTNLKSVENFGFKTTIKGVKSIAGGSGNPQLYKVRHYDSDFNAVTGDMYTNTLLVSQVDTDTVDIWLGTQDGETYHPALGKDKYNQIVYTKFLIGISSSAITVDRVPANFAITTNEPKTITGYGWYDTRMTPDYCVGLLAKTNQNASDIKEVSNRVTELENRERVAPVPSYWTDAVNTAIDKVKVLQDEGGNDVVNFMWFSDVHYGGKKTYIGNIGVICAKVMDECNIPLALMCGDTLTAGANNLATEDAVLKMLEDAWDIYYPIGTERLMLIAGNHEDAYGKYTSDTGEEVHYTNKADPKKIWNKLYRPQSTDFRRVFGGNGTYFWVDNVPQKVRFVCLNSSYYDGDAIPNGTVKAMSIAFGAEQLDWFENTALDIDTDWNVVVCVHVPPIAAYESKFSVGDYSEIRRIITESTVDIIAVFTGHMHRDNVVTGDLPCPVVTVTCAINTPYDGNVAERVAGTDKETALDVVSINKATRTINCVRIGAGVDREIDY